MTTPGGVPGYSSRWTDQTLPPMSGQVGDVRWRRARGGGGLDDGVGDGAWQERASGGDGDTRGETDCGPRTKHVGSSLSTGDVSKSHGPIMFLSLMFLSQSLSKQ